MGMLDLGFRVLASGLRVEVRPNTEQHAVEELQQQQQGEEQQQHRQQQGRVGLGI